MTESYAGALPGSSRLTLTEPRAAVADPRAESLCLGQRDELLAGAGGYKVGGVLQAEFFVHCQGIHGDLQGVALGADSRWDQECNS